MLKSISLFFLSVIVLGLSVACYFMHREARMYRCAVGVYSSNSAEEERKSFIDLKQTLGRDVRISFFKKSADGRFVSCPFSEAEAWFLQSGGKRLGYLRPIDNKNIKILMTE